MRRDHYISFCHQKVFPIFQAVALIILPLLSACGAPINVPLLAPEEIPHLEAAGNFPHRIYRIEPGDSLQIRYTFHHEMNQEVIVQPDGKITATLVGEVAAAGMTTAALEKLLVGQTSDRLLNPEVVVSISRFAERNIYIGGEVGKPGIVPYQKGLSPLQAIIAAGGFKDTAQPESVILIRTGGSDNNIVSRRLNLTEAITDGIKEPIYLAPHDVVFVPKSAIADVNLWVQQHITDIIGPFFRGVGGTMGYRLNQ